MKTRSLVCSLVLLGSGGCVVPHSLGMSEAESADEGGDGGSSSGGTGGVSMSDTGGGVGDGDGSASGGMMTASDGGPTMPTTADVDDGDGDAESSGGFDQCNPLGEQFLWLWDSMDFQGDEALWTSEVLVSGLCDLIFVDSDPLDPSIKGFAMSCTVDGRMDGTDVAGIEITPFFAAGGDLVQEALEARLPTVEPVETTLRLKLAQSNWGMGYDTWFVLEDLDGNVWFDGVSAEEIDPADDVILENDFEVLPELLPWHGALTLTVTDTDCDLFADVECGGVQQALFAAGPELEFPTVGLEVGTSGEIPGAAGPLNVFLNEALDYSQATCEDHPLALVRYASYAP